MAYSYAGLMPSPQKVEWSEKRVVAGRMELALHG